MSDIPSDNWTWDISNITDMNETELRILLQNRKCRRIEGNKRILLMRLTHNYVIDDKDSTPFHKLQKNALKVELKLRNIFTQQASNSVLLDRLTVYEIPPIEVLLTSGSCREGEKEYKLQNFPLFKSDCSTLLETQCDWILFNCKISKTCFYSGFYYKIKEKI